MDRTRLRPRTDISAAAWIAPRLTGDWGSVTGVLPAAYPAYARLCHPATDEHDNPVSWSQVAARTGRTAHPRMQWHVLIDSANALNPASPLWPGENPEQGNLDPATLHELCQVLDRHTATAEQCWFCLWEGYGWIDGGGSVVFSVSDDAEIPNHAWSPPPALDSDQLDGPRVSHPGRDYFLFSGPLWAAAELGHQVTEDWFLPQSPNLFWPQDRAWCVATEINFDSTLIAGSRALVEQLCASQNLEVYPIGPRDSLACDGDQVNQKPAG